MAATEYGVNHPLAVKRWSSELMKEALKLTSFSQFMGTTANSLVQIKSELGKEAGDRLTFGIRYQLQGDGVVGDDVLEGNEEALVTYSQDLYINQSRHAVKSKGKMSEQRVPFSVREEARDALADWFANLMDTAFFNVLTGNTAETRSSFYGHNTLSAPDSDHWITRAASEAAISATSSDAFSLELIDWAVERAKTAKVALRPLNLGKGQKRYVMFLHPYQVTSLRTNTQTGQWLDIQKAALSGGNLTKSGIFTGALGEYNGVVLHESTRIPQGATNSITRRAVLCGAQAAVMGFGQGTSGPTGFDWREDSFDYGNALGVAGAAIWGLQRTRFNGSDIGTISISTYAAAH